MATVEKELDRFLTLLRNKIRERGFTQLEVQEALGWGRSYISQLLTKQKSLRVEQVLLILEVIGVDPVEFFAELYHFPGGAFRTASGAYPDPLPGQAPHNASMVADGVAGGSESYTRAFEELRGLLRGVVRLLVDKRVIELDELSSKVQGAPAGGLLDDDDG